MFKTKEFWTALVGLVVTLGSYFGAKYLAPSVYEDVKFVVDTIVPFIFLIIGYEFYIGVVKPRIQALKKF